MRSVLLGTTLFGITGAIIGCFTFMQRQSLLGDVISHATLPGIVGALLLFQSKNPFILLFGGLCSALCGIFCMHRITTMTTLKKDTALGLVLSVFFGIGLMLLSQLQQHSEVPQGLIIKYIFGNASTIIHTDLYVISAVHVFVCTILFLFRKEFSLLLFDATQAYCLGYPVNVLQMLLTLLTVLCIISGLQPVGTVLMSSFLIAPAAAARQWTRNFSSMIMLAACFGGCAALCGTVISARFAHLPTGPVIVVFSSLIVAVSLIKHHIPLLKRTTHR